MLSVAQRKLRLAASLRALEAAADHARKQEGGPEAEKDAATRIEAMHRLIAETQVTVSLYLVCACTRMSVKSYLPAVQSSRLPVT